MIVGCFNFICHATEGYKVINQTLINILFIGHPYYVGVQYHPEYLSRPMKPSAPYLGLLLASTGKLSTYVTRGFRLSPHLSYSEGNDEELDEEIAKLSIEKSDSVESTS